MATGPGRCWPRLDERVAIAALPHCHWTDGGLLDLAAIGAALPRGRQRAGARRHPVAGALPLDLAAVAPGLPGLRRLQVAARPLQPGLPLRRAAAPGRPAARAQLDRARGQRGLRPPDRLSRRATSPARGASTSASARTSRCCRSASSGWSSCWRWGVADDRRDARGAHRRRSPSGPRARPQRVAGRRSRRPLSRPALPAGRAGRPARAPRQGAGPRQPARRFLRVTPHLYNHEATSTGCSTCSSARCRPPERPSAREPLGLVAGKPGDQRHDRARLDQIQLGPSTARRLLPWGGNRRARRARYPESAASRPAHRPAPPAARNRAAPNRRSGHVEQALPAQALDVNARRARAVAPVGLIQPMPCQRILARAQQLVQGQRAVGWSKSQMQPVVDQRLARSGASRRAARPASSRTS